MLYKNPLQNNGVVFKNLGTMFASIPDMKILLSLLLIFSFGCSGGSIGKPGNSTENSSNTTTDASGGSTGNASDGTASTESSGGPAGNGSAGGYGTILMEGPGSFSVAITKEDFPMGPTAEDLIWMDQVNGTITQEEALQQYFCAIFTTDQPCLEQKYTEEADPDSEMSKFEISNHTMRAFFGALNDPEVSEAAKEVIRLLVGMDEEGTTQSNVSKNTALFKAGNAANEEFWNAYRRELKNKRELEATTQSGKRIKINYPSASTKGLYVANTVKEALENAEDPWAKLTDFFGGIEAQPIRSDEGVAYRIIVVDNLRDVIGACYGVPSDLSGGDSFILMSSDYDKGSIDRLRGTYSLEPKEMYMGAIVHELFHAWMRRYKAINGNKPVNLNPIPLEEALADVSIDMIFPWNNLEHTSAPEYLDSSKKGFRFFSKPVNDKSHPLYLWHYYLERRYGDYNRMKNYIRRVVAGEDPWEVTASHAAENDNLLGFGVSMLNLDFAKPEKGIIRMSDEDKKEDGSPAYPPFYLMANRAPLGVLPGGTLFSDKIVYDGSDFVKPLGIYYLPLVTYDGAHQNGVFACYQIEPEMTLSEGKMGIVAIKTDPEDRASYRVVDYYDGPLSSPLSRCYQQADSRPDILVIVIANPSATEESNIKLTVTGKPFFGKLTVSGSSKKTEMNEFDHGSEQVTVELSFGDTKLSYNPSDGKSLSLNWVNWQAPHENNADVTLVGNPRRLLGHAVCPAKDANGQNVPKYVIESGTASLKYEKITERRIDCPDDDGKDGPHYQHTSTLHEELRGSTSITMREKCSGGFAAPGSNDHWVGGVVCSVTDMPVTQTIAGECDVNDNISGKNIEIPLSATVSGESTFKTGDTGLTAFHDDPDVEITFYLPSPVVEYSRYVGDNSSMLIYDGGSAPNPNYRGQLKPWITDYVGILLTYPQCM